MLYIRKSSHHGDLSAYQCLEALQVLQQKTESSLVGTLFDSGIGDIQRATTLARQIKHETTIGRKSNFATITIGNKPGEPKYTFFFENEGTFQSTGMRKLVVPYNDLLNIGGIEHKPRILFVNAKSPEYPVKTAPLGIITLGAYLKKIFGTENVEIDYIDMQTEEPSNVLGQMNEKLVDIIGISVKVGGNKVMGQLLQGIRNHSRDGKSPVIVLGNALPTYSSDQIHHTYSDVVCVIGRGEYAMERLIRFVDSGRQFEDLFTVAGASFVIGQTIFQIESRTFTPSDFGVADWETLFRKYRLSDYQEIWGAEASVGCQQKDSGVGCKFCAILPHGDSRGWMAFPEKRIVDEIRVLALYGVPHIRLPDEEFAAGKPLREFQLAQKLVDLKQALSSEGVQMPTFDFAMRVDDVFKRGKREEEPKWVLEANTSMSNNDLRREALALLKEAGLTQVYLGIESGSAPQLKRMYKAVKPEDNKNAIRTLRNLGIQIAGGWIMIDPEMKGLDELKENIKFIEEMKLIPQTRTDDFITNPINRMRVLEGSPLVVALQEKGLLRGLKENMVEYEFEYENPIIGKIADILETWEEAAHEFTYSLKNVVANARLNQESEIRAPDSYFFHMKRIDFEFFKALVELFDKTYPESPPEDEIARVLNIFQQQRKKILDDIAEDLRSSNVVDTAGTLTTRLRYVAS